MVKRVVAAWLLLSGLSAAGAEEPLSPVDGEPVAETRPPATEAPPARTPGQSAAVPPAPEVAPVAHARVAPSRMFGIGVGSGGGLTARVRAASVGGYMSGPTSAYAELGGALLLPTLEVTVFTVTGLSFGLSLGLGDTLLWAAMGAGFGLSGDLMLGFNLPVSRGVRLLLSPGLGFSGRNFSDTVFSGGGYPNSGGSGQVRGMVEAGVEVLSTDGHVGVSFAARPYVGARLALETVYPNPRTFGSAGYYSVGGEPIFGFLAVLAVKGYATREQ